MMSMWRRKRRIERKLVPEANLEKREESTINDRSTKILELGTKFRCKTCGKAATKPSKGPGEPYEVSRHGLMLRTNSYLPDDWSRPGDLSMCWCCLDWFCNDHIHEGICSKCSEKH